MSLDKFACAAAAAAAFADFATFAIKGDNHFDCQGRRNPFHPPQKLLCHLLAMC